MKKLILLLIIGLISLISYSQTITFQFQGIDSSNLQPLDLDAVKIENLTLGCDTTLLGENINSITLITNVRTPELLEKQYINSKPNPFNGKTYICFSISRPDVVNLNLYNTSGVSLSKFETSLSEGMHQFEINSNSSGALFLRITANNYHKIIKLINLSNFGSNDIKYVGIVDNHLKTYKNGNYGFNFYIGNELRCTASVTGYYDEIINDTPVEDTTYIFYLSDTTKVPTVTTQNVSNVTQTTCTANGTVVTDGGRYITERGFCWNTTGNPTIANSHINDGTSGLIGTYSLNITGLNPYTLYHLRAYAININGVACGNVVTFLTNYSYCDGISVVNYQGKNYNTIEIGNQCWLKENLDVGNLTSVSTPQTDNNITEKYYYENNPTYGEIYGRLYQWNEAMNYATNQNLLIQGLCPNGWHIPTESEWNTLGDFAGGQSIAGGPLKEEGYSHWYSPNTGATNSTNFTALPGGRYYNVTNNYDGLWYNAYFWSGTSSSSTDAKYRKLSHDNVIMSYTTTDSKNRGFSIRCIKGQGYDRANITTVNVTNITDTTALCHGYLNLDGGQPVTEIGFCYGTSPNPDINGNHVSTTVVGVNQPFQATIIDLTQLTTYYVRSYAINSVGVDYGDNFTFNTIEHDPCGGLMSISYGGKTYNLKKIGTQCWIKENLDIGVMIQGNQMQQNNGTIEKYCYNNDPAKCTLYGGLYQWDEMMNYSITPGAKGICPDGWHVPTSNDFNTVGSFLSPDEGYKMKSISGWYNNGNGSNESGFNGFPGGHGSYPNFYFNETQASVFYTSDLNRFYLQWNYNTFIGDSGIIPTFDSSSVRCVKNY